MQLVASQQGCEACSFEGLQQLCKDARRLQPTACWSSSKSYQASSLTLLYLPGSKARLGHAPHLLRRTRQSLCLHADRAARRRPAARLDHRRDQDRAGYLWPPGSAC